MSAESTKIEPLPNHETDPASAEEEIPQESKVSRLKAKLKESQEQIDYLIESNLKLQGEVAAITRLHHKKDEQLRSFQLWYTNLTHNLQQEVHQLKQSQYDHQTGARLQGDLNEVQQKVQALEKCSFPQHVTISDMNIAYTEHISDELMDRMGDLLIYSLQRGPSLYDVCNFVTKCR